MCFQSVTNSAVVSILIEWDKFIANKNSLMTIILEQCHEATRTKIALGTSYEDNFEDVPLNPRLFYTKSKILNIL